jgi:hypothetical protein
MRKRNGMRAIVFVFCLALLPTSTIRADGGYFSRQSIAVSADQRAIIIRNGNDISMTFSTGYTGEGEDFGWIIPTPVPPAVEDVMEAGEKGENAFAALDRYTAPRVHKVIPCFPAGTEVLTADGPRAIEMVDAGTKVQVCDLVTGNWTLAKVRKRTAIQYGGDVVTLDAGGIVIRATGNHPFRVLRGDRLDGRPSPRDVPKEEQATDRGGRWVEARDLKVEDILASRYGEGVAVTALSSQQERLEVFNLEVEGCHNYAVGPMGILVHNKGQHEGEPLPQVAVYGKVTLEHYEVSILGAAAASPLLAWLKGNGYAVNPAAEKVLDAYIERDWAFAAVKLNPGERRRYENEFLPPLTVRYQYDRLIFPLKISSVSTVGAARITLYVIAESTVSSSNSPTRTPQYHGSLLAGASPERYVEELIQETAMADGNGLAVMWKGEYQQSVDNQRILDDLMKSRFPERAKIHLTRLEARLDPSAMTEDIELVSDQTPERFGIFLERVSGNATPVPELGLTGVVAIAASSVGVYAFKADGTIWYPDYWSGSMRDLGVAGVAAIASGINHEVHLKKDGTVWVSGENGYGQLGDGDTTRRAYLGLVPQLFGVTAIAAGRDHTLALKDDGTVWTWGLNSDGQLGDGTTTSRSTPVQVVGLSEVTAIAAYLNHSIALKVDGTVWAWGLNRNGQLGDGTTTSRFMPVQVSDFFGVTAIAAGRGHTLALQADGTVWSWGVNTYGQLGDGSRMDRSAPVHVSGLSGVTAIAAGGEQSVALKDDGTVWVWGANNCGQLGDGSTTDRVRPVPVSSLSGVTAVAAGHDHTHALKADGTVWSWGYRFSW